MIELMKAIQNAYTNVPYADRKATAPGKKISEAVNILDSIAEDIFLTMSNDVGPWYFCMDEDLMKPNFFRFLPFKQKTEWYETLEDLLAQANPVSEPSIIFSMTPSCDIFRDWVVDTLPESHQEDEIGNYETFLQDSKIGEESDLLDIYGEDFREDLWKVLSEKGMNTSFWGEKNPVIYKFYKDKLYPQKKGKSPK
tara:strand:- start:265 stop:852 length:588 start_codon:yes stop_codon:yes gene_type:complete